MATVKILNESFELNMLDADENKRTNEALQKATDLLNDMQENPVEDEPQYVTITNMCNVVFECMDTIFGEDASNKIFCEKTDLLEGLEAMACLKEAVGEKQEKEVNSRLQKYMPRQIIDKKLAKKPRV